MTTIATPAYTRHHEIAGLLAELAFDLDAARAWAVRLAETIDDARRGDRSAAGQLNRADLVNQLRSLRQVPGGKTARALSALCRIEDDFLGGVRFPEPRIEQRFFGGYRGTWDQLTNRWLCHDCRVWVDQDDVPVLLMPQLPCQQGHTHCTDQTITPAQDFTAAAPAPKGET